MNKKIGIIIVLIPLILTSCGPPRDKQAQLARLEAQREALDAQIERLKAEISSEAGIAPKEALAYVRSVEIKPSLF